MTTDWHLTEWDDYAGYFCLTGGCFIKDGNGNTIAALDGGDYGQESCGPIAVEARAQLEANGRKLAAAPAMYEALRALVALYDVDRDTAEFHDTFNELADGTARAALRAAEGYE